MGLCLTKEAININIDTGGIEQALLVAKGMMNEKENGKRFWMDWKGSRF